MTQSQITRWCICIFPLSRAGRYRGGGGAERGGGGGEGGAGSDGGRGDRSQDEALRNANAS